MLTEAQFRTVGNFDQPTVDGLHDALGGGVEAASVAGALSLTTYSTELTVASTVAYTLAAPTVFGQRKKITCVAATSTPLGTVTISAPDTTAGFVCPSTMAFTAVGQEVELVATAALKWRVYKTKRAGVQVLVIGTTATAGLVLANDYSASVAGTVSSTGSNALQNGLYPGDQCFVTCSSATAIPSGAIDFVGLTAANTAITHIQSITATTVQTTLNWNGAAWFPTATVTLTFT